MRDWKSKAPRSDLAWSMGLTALAAAIRFLSQDGTLFYPDSYQFLLFAHGLGEGLPVASAMGAEGDVWAIPFYKLGYSVAVAPFVAAGLAPATAGVLASFVVGCASIPTIYYMLLVGTHSRVVAVGGALAIALSFSAVGWSRFAMSESLAIFIATVALLLATLTGESRSPRLAIATAIFGALMVLVRMELAVLLPVVLMVARGRDAETWQFEQRYLIAPWLASLAGLSFGLGWVAQHVAEAFTLNPEFYLRASFGRLLDTESQGDFGLDGLSSFFRREPLLILLSATALIAGLRARKLDLIWIWCGIALLMLVAIPRNDVRFFATTVPLLAITAGHGVNVLWRLAAFLTRSPSALFAAGASASAAFVVALVMFMQLDTSLSRWHVDEGYEDQVARLVQERLESAAGDWDAICSHSPEAYYLLVELPSRRLSQPDTSLCLRGADEDVLLVLDEPARLKLGLDEAALTQQWQLLFSLQTTAAYIDQRNAHFPTREVGVYESTSQESAVSPDAADHDSSEAR